jgi:Uma2 family endonuclease
MGAAPVAKLSVEEYLALDRAAEVKSEYHDGEMFPMESVSWAHSRISVKVGGWLDRQLSNKPCEVAGASLRLRVSPTKYLIPDFIVVCGKPTLTDEYQDIVTNPKVIIEILSPSTMDYDFGGKFHLYRRLSSFEEYVLISQDKVRVEIFRKASDNQWMLRTYEGLDAVVTLESVGVSLPLAEVYGGVELPATIED